MFLRQTGKTLAQIHLVPLPVVLLLVVSWLTSNPFMCLMVHFQACNGGIEDNHLGRLRNSRQTFALRNNCSFALLYLLNGLGVVCYLYLFYFIEGHAVTIYETWLFLV